MSKFAAIATLTHVKVETGPTPKTTPALQFTSHAAPQQPNSTPPRHDAKNSSANSQFKGRKSCR